ncbi:hypothetical protein ABW19_dt0201677 [Dactylella cylindrospora]|nr:hypothetical protein ABW19_dt0201677 [Dactylella cylindrospora]
MVGKMRGISLCCVLAVLSPVFGLEADDAPFVPKYRLPFQPPEVRDRQARAVKFDLEKRAEASSSLNSSIPYIPKWFPQKVDHADPSNNNTFQQRYWIGTSFYKPGGPVIVLEGGETSGAGRIRYMQTGVGRYLTEALGGIGIVLEHRYYGKSIVTQNLTTESLKYLNTAQSLADNAYFAENLWKELPAKMSHVRPSETPFISYGGSYAGSKSAFLQIEYPEAYYGSLASSAVIWAGENFWEYNEPVRKLGDPICVAIIEETANRIDDLSAKGGQPWDDFKDMFGVKGVEDRDAANFISGPLGMWQGGNWDKEEDGAKDWDKFCANITFGLDDRYFEASVHRNCGNGNVTRCLSTSDPAGYASTSLDSEWRLWQWQVCTEVRTVCAPAGYPTLVARIVDLPYLRRVCEYAFNMEPSFEIDVSKVLKYGGFNLTAPRLMYIDGTHDPWLYATAHSPHSPQKDRDGKLSVLIEESWHHNDENGLGDISQEPERIQKIHNLQIEVVRGWVEEFYESRGK